ncbi:AAA family ATPase [Aminobacter ciceronei]|uniref:AAA+ ATPase domain-containing protein n=1 Tax=Aminobacter ciceronei TaxID=150723 RepID=A0ABR6C627_9HYPH|nr:AAA family ATPase [Aminobacter ciceronei]MBA8906456.1 hypothetical protein [Aminobacter ciceronei]MBA9020418.1 hypothetical protein [Aminobacter ciceronei]
MIRYTHKYPHGVSSPRGIRDQIAKSFARFIAYCTLMRACRAVPQVRRQSPVVLGLVLPDGADIEIYERAAQFVAQAPMEHWLRDDSPVFISKGGRWKKGEAGEHIKALATKRRVFMVAENAQSIPDSFRAAADAIVEVGIPQPAHIIAAAKLSLGLTVTEEEASFLATVPFSLLTTMMRKGRSTAASIAMIRKALAPVDEVKAATGPTLANLHGLGEAGDWGRELAVDLADWRAGRISWSDVDRGILVSGPPGTGKTTFAQALARTCDVHLVLGSLGRWQAKGHLGDLLKAMRAAFDDAIKNAPSILFIDEIDAVGDRTKFSGHNAQYSTEVVSALLECIDGAEGREGVVIVGACNDPSRLDAALIRAGRLDRHIRVGLPDRQGREGILRWHLRGQLENDDVSMVLDRTEGWTGASLEQLVRGGRRRARRAKIALALEHLMDELPSRAPIPEGLRRRTAVHEAGHAVVAFLLGAGEIASVSVATDVAPVGGLQDGGGVVLMDSPLRERTRTQLLDQIAVRLGGMAAEEAILGDRSAGSGGTQGSDLHTATYLALRLEGSYGLGASLAYLSSEDEEELFTAMKLDRVLQARVDKVLEEQFHRVQQIIEGHRAHLEHLAEVLLAKGKVTGTEVREILGARHATGGDLFERFSHDGPRSRLGRDVKPEAPYVVPDLKKELGPK